jgi:DNA-binding CsgD family transcriptional regulator
LLINYYGKEGRSEKTCFLVNSIRPDMSKELNLTHREKEIMDLVILGYTIKEISYILNISETTVISHKQNIKDKLHARNSCHCVSLYLQHLN